MFLGFSVITLSVLDVLFLRDQSGSELSTIVLKGGHEVSSLTCDVGGGSSGISAFLSTGDSWSDALTLFHITERFSSLFIDWSLSSPEPLCVSSSGSGVKVS